MKFETQLEAIYKPEEGPNIYKLQQKAFQKAAEEQKKSVKDEL